MFKILVADDSPEVLNTYVDYLSDLNDCEISAHPHVDAALRAVKEGFEPDLVITDFDFGSGYENGLGFVKKLRESGFAKPIVMITGCWKPSVLDLARQRGLEESDFQIFEKGHVSLRSVFRRLIHTGDAPKSLLD